MAQRDTLLSLCNDLLQPQLFKDYCPNGLQVEGRTEVKKSSPVSLRAWLSYTQRLNKVLILCWFTTVCFGAAMTAQSPVG